MACLCMRPSSVWRRKLTPVLSPQENKVLRAELEILRRYAAIGRKLQRGRDGAAATAVNQKARSATPEREREHVAAKVATKAKRYAGARSASAVPAAGTGALNQPMGSPGCRL